MSVPGLPRKEVAKEAWFRLLAPMFLGPQVTIYNRKNQEISQTIKHIKQGTKKNVTGLSNKLWREFKNQME